MTVRFAVIGLGYWGQNYPRVLRDLPGATLAALCDVDASQLERAARRWPDIPTFDRIDSLFDSGVADAVIVGTPASTHFEVASQALGAGLHTLVEKPLASRSDEAAKLNEEALARGLVLLVGHTFLYSPRVEYIRDVIAGGELGSIRYLYSRRLNLGKVRNDVDALWNFGPHDVSIVMHLLGSSPVRVGAQSLHCLGRPVGDVSFVNLEFPGPVWAHLHMSWLDPKKVREMVIVGSKRMLVYDDVDGSEPIRIFDAGVTPDAEGVSFADYAEFQINVRQGSVVSPKISGEEPLARQCAHFIRCITQGETPITPASQGVEVVRVLEAATRSAERRGTEVKLVPA
jgi:predicted dehydrogenase